MSRVWDMFGKPMVNTLTIDRSINCQLWIVIVHLDEAKQSAGTRPDWLHCLLYGFSSTLKVYMVAVSVCSAMDGLSLLLIFLKKVGHLYLPHSTKEPEMKFPHEVP